MLDLVRFYDCLLFEIRCFADGLLVLHWCWRGTEACTRGELIDNSICIMKENQEYPKYLYLLHWLGVLHLVIRARTERYFS